MLTNDKTDYYKPIQPCYSEGWQDRIQCLTKEDERKVLVSIKQQFERNGDYMFPSKSLLFREAIHAVYLHAKSVDDVKLFDCYSKFRNLKKPSSSKTKKTVKEAFRILDDKMVDEINFIINQIYTAKGFGHKIHNRSSLIKFILFVFKDKHLKIGASSDT